MTTHSDFGTLPDGREVQAYELKNSHGVEIRILNYGGIVQSLRVPDASGALGDVVLGYDDLASYVAQTSYFGTIIGRYANRIARSRFEIDGNPFPLLANDGAHHLHGGSRGFDKVLWRATIPRDTQDPALVLAHHSTDMEGGYPGNLKVMVRYRLTEANEMVLDYQASTDRPTPVNLTHHSYFNLAGSGDVLDHELKIFADWFTPVAEGLIPTGELRAVHGTPFDFRRPRRIGAFIKSADRQLEIGDGYDHNFVLSHARKTDLAEGMPAMPAARVNEASTGRTLEIETTEPGLQFYSGNSLGAGILGKSGQAYGRHSGFCLETQHYPDSPNRPTFPDTILRPGHEYRSRTIYRFGVESPAGA